MDDDCLTKIILFWSYRTHSTWCSQVKEILNIISYNLNMCSYFDFIRSCDINEFKFKLFTFYEDQWKLKTKSLPKFGTYVTLKKPHSIRTLSNNGHNQIGKVFDGTIQMSNPSSEGRNWSLSK